MRSVAEISPLDINSSIVIQEQDVPVCGIQSFKEGSVYDNLLPIKDQYGVLVAEMWKNDIQLASYLFSIPNEECSNV